MAHVLLTWASRSKDEEVREVKNLEEFFALVREVGGHVIVADRGYFTDTWRWSDRLPEGCVAEVEVYDDYVE